MSTKDLAERLRTIAADLKKNSNERYYITDRAETTFKDLMDATTEAADALSRLATGGEVELETTAEEREFSLTIQQLREHFGDEPDGIVIRLLRDFDRLTSALTAANAAREAVEERANRWAKYADRVQPMLDRLAVTEKALVEAYDNAGRSATDRFDVPPEHEPNPNAFHLGWEMCAREIAGSIATKKIAALKTPTPEGGQ